MIIEEKEKGTRERQPFSARTCEKNRGICQFQHFVKMYIYTRIRCNNISNKLIIINNTFLATTINNTARYFNQMKIPRLSIEEVIPEILH